MTHDELIAAVPVHERDGRPLYVSLEDIPQPRRDQFWAALPARLPMPRGSSSSTATVLSPVLGMSALAAQRRRFCGRC